MERKEEGEVLEDLRMESLCASTGCLETCTSGPYGAVNVGSTWVGEGWRSLVDARPALDTASSSEDFPSMAVARSIDEWGGITILGVWVLFFVVGCCFNGFD